MSTTTPSDNTTLPHIIIIGCGFGGLEAAKAFKDQPVRVTLIDRSNHHLFQPLLYQVATAGLAAPLISAPIRHLFRAQSNVTTLLGEVVGIDALAKQVSFKLPHQISADEPVRQLSFDYLIAAAGATHSYFGNDAWASHAPGLKTLSDAMELRRRILFAFEAAEAEDDAARREALLTFVVIGAGPTGVEMAGTLAEIAHHTLPGEFRRINPASAKVILVEGTSRVLQAMPESLSSKALAQLHALGVEVRLQARVTKIDADGIEVQTQNPPEAKASESASRPGKISLSSYQIHSNTVIWAAGVAASPLGQMLAQSLPAEPSNQAISVPLDRAGRVIVQPDLSLPGLPHISVIGDMAAAQSHHQGKTSPVPGVSPAAKQMGQLAATNILRRLQGQATQAFRYRDYGNLATIGRNAAVVDLTLPFGLLGGNLRFSGKLAWLFWLFAHIYFLIGFRNRAVVLADWASAYLSFSRSARVVTEMAKADT
jgi:NADH:ubiquinone reductase (H+-translocating)